ncbi:unannotated protein [freshwater metagenome]|uniref:Unannotated protein n=1 Tax=freshwater metagenome TaxID=449393 RepID=A0A6J7L1W5_9ZZZZ
MGGPSRPTCRRHRRPGTAGCAHLTAAEAVGRHLRTCADRRVAHRRDGAAHLHGGPHHHRRADCPVGGRHQRHRVAAVHPCRCARRTFRDTHHRCAPRAGRSGRPAQHGHEYAAGVVTRRPARWCTCGRRGHPAHMGHCRSRPCAAGTRRHGGGRCRRHRPRARRTARIDRRHHWRRQERVAAHAGGGDGGQRSPRTPDVRTHRLQGRRHIRRLRRTATCGGSDHRPR